MDPPPPILSYASPNTEVVAADGRVVLLAPPPAWEIVLISLTLLVLGFGALFAGGTVLETFRYDSFRFVGGLILLTLTLGLGVVFARKLIRRQRYGRLPCTIWREQDVLFIDFPAHWDVRPRRFGRSEFAHATLHRRGWSLNLRPLYTLVIRHPLAENTLKIPFTAAAGEASRLYTRVVELLR